jgi:hypothetical protein
MPEQQNGFRRGGSTIDVLNIFHKMALKRQIDGRLKTRMLCCVIYHKESYPVLNCNGYDLSVGRAILRDDRPCGRLVLLYTSQKRFSENSSLEDYSSEHSSSENSSPGNSSPRIFFRMGGTFFVEEFFAWNNFSLTIILRRNFFRRGILRRGIFRLTFFLMSGTFFVGEFFARNYFSLRIILRRNNLRRNILRQVIFSVGRKILRWSILR